MKPVTTSTLKAMKKEQKKIAMVTAYDYPTAKLVEKAGIDVVLVGDSLGMTVLGYESTVSVKVPDMVHHTKAVKRGAQRALVVTDLPFLSYQGSFDQTVEASRAIMQDGGAHAVKMEGGEELVPTISKLTTAGVPVMGHIGLTPQSVHQFGGYKVQGKDVASAQKLIQDAHALQEAGIFSLVLECVPSALAHYISEQLHIPTIGIGAGVGCDGQVLVFHDMVGYGSDLAPKFVKNYAQTGDDVTQAVEQYVQEVRSGTFPGEEHSFTIKEDVLQKIEQGKVDPLS